jgi:23S rRNA pseudouridine2605 synthase
LDMKRKTDNFSKFYNKKRNSAIKEGFRQEKKAAKKERKEAIERRFEEKRQARSAQFPDRNAPTGRPTRGGAPGGRPVRGGAPTGKPFRGAAPTGRPVRGAASFGRSAPAGRNEPMGRPAPAERTAPVGRHTPAGKNAPKPTITLRQAPAGSPVRPDGPAAKTTTGAPVRPTGPAPKGPAPSAVTTGETLPLNKYIAHGGICSRRDAADLIRVGKVSVNGKIVTEPGTKVLPTDTVKVNDKKVTISRNFVYILLNKPKDYITTTDDPQGRKTVLDLIRAATPERVFPVGRLDRNTSGVLLLTNDGDLAQKLAHPSHEIKKIYHVTLDKALSKGDFDKIIGGEVKLEDGVANVDVLAYADPKDKTQIGLEIHSGRNRIVRRIFEQLGYDVRGLDRVMYAGLTKKNVQRGMWRLLSEKEIRILKYLNSSIKGSPAKTKEWAAANADGNTYTKGAAGGTSAKPTAKGAGAAAAKNARPAPAPEKAAGPAAAAAKSAYPAKPGANAAKPDAGTTKPSSGSRTTKPGARGPKRDGGARTSKPGTSSRAGRRPPSSTIPKGRKPARGGKPGAHAAKPNSRRSSKPTKFNNEGD